MKQFPESKKEYLQTTIEVVGPEEWETFRAIRLKALQADPTAFGVSYEQQANQSEEEWRSKLSDPHRRMYAAKINEQMAAIAGVHFMTAKHVEHVATLVAVFTDPEFRNQGIATSLMEKILEDLRNDPKIVKVRLSVSETQSAAKKLYEKMGFVQVGLAKKEMKIDGTYYDHAQMELIFEDKL